MTEQEKAGVRIERPARAVLKHLVMDLNGTIALDGTPLPGVGEILAEISKSLDIHLVSADTFNTAERLGPALSCTVHRLKADKPGGPAKAEFVRKLGAETVAAIGNGVNDVPMFGKAALSIAVIGPEGAAAVAVAAADIVVRDPVAGLKLLLHPRRILATLRD